MLEEIEALRREKAEEMSRMKRDFEEGRAGGVAQIQKESLEDDLFNELQQKADHQKIKNNFERTAEDEEKQKDCCICSKVVYPVEKIWVGKQLYHTNCFKCSKCGKKLSQNTEKSTSINCYYFNCRSIVNKLCDLRHFVGVENPDLLMLSETWVRDTTLTADELSLNAKYQVYLSNRSNNDKKKGGGVAILIRSDIPSKKILAQNKN
uniref:LIM zinc-binding domain-containing protein n=1 Tax=Meloidogyne floridensis TaxID=298350 RepID=A0A915NCD3_9BILA